MDGWKIVILMNNGEKMQNHPIGGVIKWVAIGNWLRRNLTVVPIPDGDVIRIIGSDEPGVHGMQLDFPNLLVSRAKCPQSHHSPRWLIYTLMRYVWLMQNERGRLREKRERALRTDHKQVANEDIRAFPAKNWVMLGYSFFFLFLFLF